MVGKRRDNVKTLTIATARRWKNKEKAPPVNSESIILSIAPFKESDSMICSIPDKINIGQDNCFCAIIYKNTGFVSKRYISRQSVTILGYTFHLL